MSKCISSAVVLLLVAAVSAEQPHPIVTKSEREKLYLVTLEKMRAIARPINRIDASESRVDVVLDRTASGYRGELQPFWRTCVLPDRWLAPAAWSVPSRDPIVALLERETGRTLSAHPKSARLDTSISCVRLLGGWHPSWKNGEVQPGSSIDEYDLAYRDPSGTIQYRWNLLAGRLDPIIDNGLTPLLVLDNVPYCFAGGANVTYGQNLAPDNFEEWDGFIEALCRELVSLYGFEKVNGWRFRVGTEVDNPNHWENGAEDSLEKYLKTYDVAAAAIKNVLPGASVGPSNFNSMFAGQLTRQVPAEAIFEHFAHGTNYATGAIGSPVDFIATSSYGMYWMGGNFDHPDAAAHGYSPDVLRLHANKLKCLRGISPRFADIPIEAHEHGTLFDKDEGPLSGEPGAFGAAWTATQYIVGIEEGMDQIFHWNDAERVGGKMILYGHGWLRVMFEKMAGGKVWVPAVENASESSFIDALAVEKDQKLYVMISCYNAERDQAGTETIRCSIPSKYLQAEIRQIQLSADTAPFNAIQQDLLDAGQAKAGMNSVSLMATPKGVALVHANAAEYVKLQDESFVWKPLGSALVDGELTVSVPTPSVTFIELTNLQ